MILWTLCDNVDDKSISRTRSLCGLNSIQIRDTSARNRLLFYYAHARNFGRRVGKIGDVISLNVERGRNPHRTRLISSRSDRKFNPRVDGGRRRVPVSCSASATGTRGPPGPEDPALPLPRSG